MKAVVDRLTADLQLHNVKRVADVGANTGVWGRRFKAVHAPTCHLTGFELRETTPLPGYNHWIQGDYLEAEAPHQFDLTWSNPPFTLSEQFIRKMLRETRDGGTVAVLQRANFIGSGGDTLPAAISHQAVQA